MIHAAISPDALIRLGHMMLLWQSAGAHVVNLPWMASQAAMDATRPPERSPNSDIGTSFGFLVASGEQSFMDLREDDWANGQTYLGWTPCFRHEPTFDSTHHYYFVKAEVFVPVEENKIAEEVDRVRNIAMMGFESALRLSNHTARLEFRQTGAAAYDIECNGIEVGSYGARQFKGKWYVFGTALAEPRWSEAVANPKQ